jgi:preprotein translocase subunit YajC
MLIWLGLMAIIFWFLLFRPKQKEQKQRNQMLSSLKKYDKVMTIGGVIGTVMEVREDEVVLKVDESTNARIKFSRGAIQRILTSAEPDNKSEKTS